MSSIVLAFKPHWVNGGWLKLFTDPYAELDGDLQVCSWSEPTRVPAVAGAHTLRTFVRYRHVFHGDLGSGTHVVEVPLTGDVRVTTANGFSNQSPFVPRVLP